MPAPFSSADRNRTSAGESISRAEILSAMSFALDLTEGARPGHALRSCLLGMRIAREIGLAENDRSSLYYALLLKDIGCSSNAARMANAFVADERVVKYNFKFIDRQELGRPNRESLSFIWNNVAPHGGAWNRIRYISQMMRSKGDLTAEMIETRCERGGAILRKFGMNDGTCDAVYALDEHWNGHGLPRHLQATKIPLLARISTVAQHLDMFCGEAGEGKAMSTLRERSAIWFDPEIVRAVSSLERRQELWTWCLPGDDLRVLRAVVLALDPGGLSALSAGDVDVICGGFADVVDAKGTYTFRHSVGVTEMAVLLAEHMHLAPERVTTIRRAALLHDIGHLGVSNRILDKPGALTEEEWTVMRQHPSLSREILSRIHAFAEVAELAEQHHERLDGSGYPRGLTGDVLSLESRILAVADVFSAMMETRPYRANLSLNEVQMRLSDEVPDRLDGNCVEAILSVLDQVAYTPVEGGGGVSYCPPPFSADASAITI